MVTTMSESYWDGENWLDVDIDGDLIIYYLGGELHRNDGPCEIDYYDNGDIYTEIYCLNGILNRKDGPAEICYDGYVSKEKYYLDGRLHRDNGPAVINYYNNGKVKKKFIL